METKTIIKKIKNRFGLNNDSLLLIEKVLNGYIKKEDFDFWQKVKDFSPNTKAKNPPSLLIKDDETDETLKIEFTNHPLNLFAFYLMDKYGEKTGVFYLAALIMSKKKFANFVEKFNF